MSRKSPFERGTPESQGVATSAVDQFVERVEAERLGLHSFMLLRHGVVVAEAWWRPFSAEVPHILYSLTKSFTSTAAGFAVVEGLLRLDDPVLSYFRQAAPRDPSEHWQAMTIRHLLTMTTGHEADPGEQIGRFPPKEWLRRIFDTPLPYAPGTHFVYNSTASNLVSIIVQKLSGQKLINYLRDRLFRPLDIGRPYWETNPLGHNWGGWGLYLRTDEVARFGQALLQRGKWQGQQVIPAEWVDQATRKQVSNGDDPDSDWAQGYGFQYWMSRHGFRGDGAFGQFCVVLRERELVLVTTAASPDMQAVLNAAWETLLPGLASRPLPENPPAVAALRERLARVEIEEPMGDATSPIEARVAGRSYRLDDNPLGWRSVRLQRSGESVALRLETSEGEETIPCGMAGWQPSQLKLDMPMVLPVAATARWSDPDTLDAAIIYLNPGATRRLALHFDGDTLELRTRLSGTFAPPTEITTAGRVT